MSYVLAVNNEEGDDHSSHTIIREPNRERWERSAAPIPVTRTIPAMPISRGNIL